jgi:hypothetical protein
LQEMSVAMRIHLALLAAVTAVTVATGADIANAASCSDHANACVKHETALGKSASRCAAPKRACLAACRQGKPAAFVGPSTGTAFPATECR